MPNNSFQFAFFPVDNGPSGPVTQPTATILPLAPEEIAVHQGPLVQTYRVLEFGNAPVTRGREPIAISWQCWFPGPARAATLGVGGPATSDYVISPSIDALTIANRLSSWCTGDPDKLKPPTPVRLLVTDPADPAGARGASLLPNVASYFWIQSFDYKPRGGWGDIYYQISLLEYRPVLILADGEKPTTTDPFNPSAGPVPTDDGAPARADPGPAATYTILPGESLWLIAQKLYGDGSRWQDIYNANSAAIGTNPNVIQPGVELTIPGGSGSDDQPEQPAQ